MSQTSKNDLNEFFRQKKKHAGKSKINWDKEKTKWIAALTDLYNQIKGFVHTAENQNLVTLSTRQKTLVEPHLGSYKVDELVLTVGDERVIFSPKGRNVMGAIGRVDVIGEGDEGMQVLQPGPRWQIVKSKFPELRIIPLNKNNFSEILRAVMLP